MELLLFLGLIAVLVLAAWGAIGFLRQRREGTVIAVTVSSRRLAAHQHKTQTGRAASAHK